MSMSDRRAELFADLISHATAELKTLGVTADVAEHCACALADHLAAHWGGQVISFPNEYAVRLSHREREIIAARDAGDAPHVLARRYGISESGIRKLLRRVAARAPIDVQLSMFDEPPATE